MNSVPVSFWEWMASLGPDRMPMFTIGTLAIVFMVTVVFCTIYKMHKNRLEDSLKRELLERGMSADEIATVVRSRPVRSATVNPNDI